MPPIIYLLLFITGYLIGRVLYLISYHYKIISPWIIGAIGLLIGIILINHEGGMITLSLGGGLFISDISDFFNLKILTPKIHDEKLRFFSF